MTFTVVMRPWRTPERRHVGAEAASGGRSGLVMNNPGYQPTKRYLISDQIALTPSFQFIFFPSRLLRPR